jgi:hypothetical protein
MASTNELIALGDDQDFRQRVRALFYLESGVVYAENPATANHSARALFASKIMTNQIDGGSFAPALAQRTNLAAETVTYNFDDQRVETSATDAEIRSQISTDFNLFAGIA